MPTLKEYFAPNAEQAVDVRAGEAGQEALVRAGRMTEEHARASGAIVAQGIGEVAHGVEAAGANVKKIVDNWTYSHDVVKQDAWLTGKQAEFTQKLQQAEKTWDPNDLDAPNRFIRENWAPLQEQYQAGFSNRRAAQRGEDLFRGATEHFQNVATSDFMDRAGAAKLLNLQQTGQNLENLAALDPSSTPQAHRQVDETAAAMKASNNVGPRYAAAADEYAQKQHQAIDKASLTAMLVSNPAGAEKLASGGFWKYLPAGAVNKAVQTAKRQQIEWNYSQQEHAYATQEHNSRMFAENWVGGLRDPATGNIRTPTPEDMAKLNVATYSGALMPSDAVFAHNLASTAIRQSVEGFKPGDQLTLAQLHKEVTDPNSTVAMDHVAEALKDGHINANEASNLTYVHGLATSTDPVVREAFRVDQGVDFAIKADLKIDQSLFSPLGMTVQQADQYNQATRWWQDYKQETLRPGTTLRDLQDPKSRLYWVNSYLRWKAQQGWQSLNTPLPGTGANAAANDFIRRAQTTPPGGEGRDINSPAGKAAVPPPFTAPPLVIK